MGISLKDVIYGIGGGIPGGRDFKSIQIGGPSGGCIPAKMLDLPVDYESLTEAGAMMGSGGMIVMDDKTCMVDIAKYFLNFLRDESCGKCVSCREGTQRMWEIVKKITEGKGTERDLVVLEDVARTCKDASLCGLGQTAANPVLSTLQYFRHEYEAHILDKRCPAGVCTALIRYVVVAEKCTGCLACKTACPTQAIKGTLKEVHLIEQAKCIKCGACQEACRFEAIEAQRAEAIQVI
jgi:ferredoxin